MSKDFSNTKLSEETAKKFLRALSTEQVDAILQSHPVFSSEKNWRPYGNAEKNWDRVGVQTSEPVGALAELVINSIDAILMRRAREEKIDFRNSSLNNMSEAVKRFFPEVLEGRLTLMSNEQRKKLAEQSVLIGIQRKQKRTKYPNYTLVDFGEGQNHTEFENTFLSLGEKNKEGIPFVQGRFNMGSTGSITFCTCADIRKGMYKFILSKRNLADSDGRWGWTLIRVRKVRKGEDLPVVEYFCPDKEIASFTANEIRAFHDKKGERKDIGVIKNGGSVVKLYEYDIGPGARDVDLGLYNALTTSLIDCALPLRLYDFDAKPQPTRGGLRAEGITDRPFAGMKAVLKLGDEADEPGDVADDESGDVAFEQVIPNSENADLGTIRIAYYGLDNMKGFLRKYPHRMFYTINGQAQAKERASLLGRAELDDLRNHLIVQIDCDSMDSTARSAIFKPDRERMADINLTRELRKIVVETLRDSEELKAYKRKIRDRRTREQIEDEVGQNFLADLVKNNPDLRELFDMGDAVTVTGEIPGGVSDYKGEKFPTYLRPKKLEKGNIKKVPIDNYRIIECETDVRNDYLMRDADRGRFLHPQASVLPNKATLRNGRLRIRVRAPIGAKEGDKIPVQFGFEDSNTARTEPLVFDATIKIVATEKPNTSPGGTPGGVRSHPQPGLNFPKIEWVEKENWDDHEFDEDSGGWVSRGEELIIYINHANRFLLAMLEKESDENKRDLIQHRFRIGLGILTFALHKKLVHDEEKKEDEEKSNLEDADLALRLASSAIAPHVVTLIDRLGGNK